MQRIRVNGYHQKVNRRDLKSKAEARSKVIESLLALPPHTAASPKEIAQLSKLGVSRVYKALHSLPTNTRDYFNKDRVLHGYVYSLTDKGRRFYARSRPKEK